jgi:hypothetical protein
MSPDGKCALQEKELAEDVLLNLYDEINALRKEKKVLTKENRDQREKIEEYEELMNNQQSELLELGKRIAELESSLHNANRFSNAALEKQKSVGGHSPLIHKWHSGRLPDGPPPGKLREGLMTVESSDFESSRECDSKSLFSLSESDDTASDATLDVQRRIPTRSSRGIK